MMPFTPPTVRYELRIFPADEHGGMKTENEFTEFVDFVDINSVKRAAGILSKTHNGPVDIAYADDRYPWDERYMTTAMPSEYHKSGYRFERLD
jgi:hypothetical protein